MSCFEISHDQKRMCSHSFSYIVGLQDGAGHESLKFEPLLGAKPVASGLKGCLGVQVITSKIILSTSCIFLVVQKRKEL